MSTSIKKFMFDSCKMLDITCKESGEDVYELQIPTVLEEYFNFEKQIDVTFDESKGDRFMFLQEDSFLVRKIASLVSQKKRAFLQASRLVSSSPSESLYFCFKITVKGVRIEEFISYYRYDLAEETSEKLVDKDFYEIMKSIKRETFTLSNEVIEKAEEQVVEGVKEVAKQIARKIDQKQKIVAKKEINRIEEYFELVRKEHHSSYTHTSYEDYGIINQEKDNLIEQQIEKYSIHSDNLSIRTLAVLHIKEKQEV